MSRLSFHGAAGTVTGSCFLLENESSKVLIDCGFFQGGPELEKLNSEQFSFDPSTLSCVLLTHAHLDHCGRLPILAKNGFHGDIYMTAATKALLEIALLDAAHIAEENGTNLFTKEHALAIIAQAKVVEYDMPFELYGYEITYINAGHILGSASIKVTDKANDKKLVFSGDLGNTPQDLILPTEYVTEGEIVLMESTYGDTVHPIEEPNVILQKEINEVEKSGGTLLIPTFSIERTQELLHRIDHLKSDGKIKPDTPVFLDSPMAIAVTEVFEKFKDLYNAELSNHTKMNDPFSFPGLSIVRHGKESDRLKEIKGTKVILAGSGMMNGGRIVNHAKTFLPIPTTRLLFVGYQAVDTLGRKILEGAKTVEIENEEITINATITVSHGLSSHADQPRLIKWISNIKGVNKLFLIHGEDDAREALKAKIIETMPSLEITMPQLEEKVDIY